MSYDLCFWKQRPDSPADPHQTYELLLNDERVDGLEYLPTDRMMTRIAETFADGWERLDEYNWEREGGSFQISISPQSVVIHSYSLPGEVLNLFIDIAAEFGCKLFDPQSNLRFEGQ